MKTHRVAVESGGGRRIIDITREVEMFVGREKDGFVNISLPHATAGLALMELGSGSEDDLLSRIDELFPREDTYRHSHGSKGHGADHLLPAFINPTLTLPVIGGEVSLGTWQRIALIDTNVDNPHREILLSFLSSND